MIRVHDLLQRRVLVTRESAHLLEQPLRQAMHLSPVVLDFEGIEAVTPSFVDEALGILREIADQAGVWPLEVRFENAPTALSSKFEAIGRARGVRLSESEGTWAIAPT